MSRRLLFFALLLAGGLPLPAGDDAGAPELLRGPYLQGLGETSVEILWVMNSPGEGRVRYVGEDGRVVEQVGAKATVPGIPLYVFNIPRRLHGAYIFHNGFEAATRLYRLKSTSGIYDGDRRLDQNGVIPNGVAVFHLGHIEGF